MTTLTAPTTVIAPPAVPHQRRAQWSNWGKIAHCQPDYLFAPRAIDEVSAVVRFAHETGRRVRAVTTGHAWSALVPTDDILIDVTRIDAIALDLTDPRQPRVRVECGATVAQVNAVLEDAGYALPYNVVLEGVRFGGLIATGSHGSGWNHATLSELVYAIDLIDARGELRHFQSDIDSAEVMNAVRLHLGMFGVMVRITLDIQPTWTVRARDRRVPIAEALDRLPELVMNNDNCDFFWWPFTDRLWVKTWTREDSPVTARPRHNRFERVRSMMEVRVYQQVLEAMSRSPGLTPRVIPLTFPFTPSNREAVLPIVEAVHYRRGIELTTMGCVEIAFKVDAGFTLVRDAMQVVFDHTRFHAARGHYPLNVTMNVRFIDHSDALLSPAYGAGHTCYIEILSRAHQPAWEGFASEVAAEWLKLPAAMPHWAKEFAFIPGITDHIHGAIGDRIARFNAVKESLALDPDHQFVNDLLRPIFLPTP